MHKIHEKLNPLFTVFKVFTVGQHWTLLYAAWTLEGGLISKTYNPVRIFGTLH